MELVDTSVGSSSTDFTPPTFTPAQKTAQKLQQLGISPLNVVSDFLTSVREVAMASIQRTYDSDWVRESRVEYILTVPAIWTDSAKDLMVQAAVAAGFGEHRIDFDLVSEPESAAGMVYPSDC